MKPNNPPRLIVPVPPPLYRPSRRKCLQLAGSGALATAMPGLSAPAHANSHTGLLLPSSELVYDLEGMHNGIRYKASASLRWQHNANAYTAEWFARILMVFKRRQSSQGHIVHNALQPHTFIDDSKQLRQTVFDSTAQRITFAHGGHTPWSADTQDRLSLYFMLPQLMAQTRFKQQNHFNLAVAGTNGLSAWRFNLGARDMIQTPMGQWSAQTVTRLKREANDTSAKLWFGGANDLLPLRIRLEDSDGTWLEQNLRSQRRMGDLPA